MTNTDNPDTQRLKSVNQAFSVIEYLHENNGVTVSEAANDLEMPVSTAHVYLNTLVETKFVVKKNNEYRCSFQFLRIGGARLDSMTLYRAAKPELDELREETGEHTNVTVHENGYSVQLYKSQGPETIDENAPIGDHLYLHSTATGKAMLSQCSEEEVETIIAERGLPALTENTVTDRDELYEQLEQIRERGFSINHGEHVPGVRAVGTAIRSEPDDLLGAISISGPLSRMDADRIEDDLAPKLLSKKNIIELKIRQFS